MNNEPVAWINEEMQVMFLKDLADAYPTLWKPLYTHPVNPKYDPETGEPLIDGYPLFSGLPHPVKELALTDEEMISIYEKDWSGIKCGLGRAVEQAILLKAQE